MKRELALMLALACSGGAAAAQETVFVIRHAEKEAQPDDPALTEAGRARSARWATMLAEAELDAVIHTDAVRSRETAGIIADALGVPHAEVGKADVAGLVDLLSFDHEEDRVLVVAHTETIPGIVRLLGADKPATIGLDDFATLFVLGAERDGARPLIRLTMP